tara:strand:- start:777 stop:1535 length:759 start_codon:yes stop_codon:yes gene_type:complete
MSPMQIISLIDEYNSDPRKFTDAESEVVAELAKAMNRSFKRESKPIRKAIFELGDMATFGLLPDSYRPVSRGEKAFGETDTDSMASGIGMIGGLAAGILGAGKAVSFGAGALKSRAGDALKAVRNRMSGVGQRMSPITEGASQMAGSLGRGAAGLGMGMGRAGANYARMGKFKAASSLAKNLNIPMDVAEKYLNYSAVGAGSLLGLSALIGGEALPVLEEGTPKNPFSSYYNYPKLYGNAPAEERYFSDPNR